MPPLSLFHRVPLNSNWPLSFETDGFEIVRVSESRTTVNKCGHSVDLCQWLRPELWNGGARLSLQNASSRWIRERAELICIASGWRPVEGTVWLLGTPIPGQVGDAYMICGNPDKVIDLCEALASDPFVELRLRGDRVRDWRQIWRGHRVGPGIGWVTEEESGNAIQEEVLVRWVYLRFIDGRGTATLQSFTEYLSEQLIARSLQFTMKQGVFLVS